MSIQSIRDVTQLDSTDGRYVPSSTDDSENSFSAFLNVPKSLEEIFEKASKESGVPVNLLKAITKQESDFDPKATSRRGAQGLMQLMPATAASLGVTDAYDPEQNIMGGSKYFSWLLKQYDGDVTLALAAYNAGTNNVEKYGGVPPFEETRTFIARITQYMRDGVDVPDMMVASTAEEPAVEDLSALEQLAEDIFSYEQYTRFLELYSKLSNIQNSLGFLNNDDNSSLFSNDSSESSASMAFQRMQFKSNIWNKLNNADNSI